VTLPIVAVLGARFWSYYAVFPVILLPITAKTVREVVYETKHISVEVGWFVYLVIPMALAVTAAYWYAKMAKAGQRGPEFTRGALLICTWVYFLLNWAYFDYPWPWAEWTARTPNGIIFAVCAVGLTALALAAGGHKRETGASYAQ